MKKEENEKERMWEQKKCSICVITSEWLYDAMLELPDKQREVLILDFWYGYTDIEIASHFHVTPRTIYNWRKKAFAAIRHHYERKVYGKE